MKNAYEIKISRRILDEKRRFGIGTLVLTLIALGLTTVPLASCQKEPTQQYGKQMDIPAGFDLFKTVEGDTRFTFGEEFTIPEGFFDKGSSPFAGTISFKGVPVGSYRSQKTGDADTIMERTKAASPSGNGRAVVPIVLAALSLESMEPVKVQVGKESQEWSVKLALSPNRKSEGTMTIMRRGENEGTFSSEFVVYPVFTFTRASDKAEKSLDVGAMKLDDKSINKITLRATEAPWSVTTAGFAAGVTLAGNVTSIRHSAPNKSHVVIRVPIFLNQ